MSLPFAMLHVPCVAVSWLFLLILFCYWGRRVCHDTLVAGGMQAQVNINCAKQTDWFEHVIVR
jgi:hypothetical protein